MKTVFWFFLLFFTNILTAQTLVGTVTANGKPRNGATVLVNQRMKISTDKQGRYQFALGPGTYSVSVSAPGFKTQQQPVVIDSMPVTLDFDLQSEQTLDEVVITGTMKAVSRVESPVPVEIYKPTFFKKNPTPNIFEAMQNVNGVRPQINCNVCNTGDIHINGLEGPYTLVLIDGMPIVSGLSTVYGLSGIPNSLIDRIEIVKGPASSLYGSEAVGGLINIVTKNPKNAAAFSADVFSTSWGEANLDLGFKTDVGKAATLLLGANYFNYSNPIDNNHDNFTDVTLQDRISVFQKWNFKRKSNKLFSMAGRYFYEDRWGGELQWNKNFRGGDVVYGESIYTKRWEILGSYELPLTEKMLLSFSYTDHDQNSVYGNMPYLAQQKIGFGQLTWDKQKGAHDWLFGAALRYQFYNDNTPATVTSDQTWIPGVFAQDEIALGEQHKLLAGLRWDYNNRHGSILTPRLAYKWEVTDNDILRLNAGTGFRVVNLFTEEHAALTGSRDVVILEDLKPERSYNANLNYLKKIHTADGSFIALEGTAWYTHFTNSILPDYETNPNQIVYKNLDGHSVSQGVSLNTDMVFGGLKVILGATFMDVSKTENGQKTRQILTEKWSGTWAVSYSFPKAFLDLDYTGNLYGPMRLPTLGALDPRRAESEPFSIQNIQARFRGVKGFEFYAGVKNLLNWTPQHGNPFIIARANDPFDKNVQFDPSGNVIATPDNPYALTFDPSYVYGPNQGIRTFMGIRYTFR
ncbi:TonB-dependent receptor [Flavobacterium caeni]|uniref:Outer membrane receptor for ferrienterochelin and colicins n=1 Tax=Flavobacterium caeni TaxID=490189 RepID=A0A1G5DYA4_9FLAO|nr:TonB-dependent receptor [Flavobacterium caeni]SCY19702.1 outer membrane receptor for ferrienterochelin and colicins [Flavobacterium caeni]